VTLESRYIWDVYHAEGIARDVYRQMLGERSEADVFQCLAWLYDGMPRRA
jgi:3-hydroxybenzoate 6-monooxygenase